MNKQDILYILSIVEKWDNCDNIWWRTDSEYAPITFFVNCNDLFAWGFADCEDLTIDNIDQYNQAMEDAKKAYKYGEFYGDILFCARMREMRPQGACYTEHKELWSLFDACGPERETGFGNPYKPGEYKNKYFNLHNRIKRWLLKQIKRYL